MLKKYKFLMVISLCFFLSSCEHFLYKCSEFSTDKIGDHKIKCK